MLLKSSLASTKPLPFASGSAPSGEIPVASEIIHGQSFLGLLRAGTLPSLERLINKVLRQKPGEYCGVYSILLTIRVTIWCEGPPCHLKAGCAGARSQ